MRRRLVVGLVASIAVGALTLAVASLPGGGSSLRRAGGSASGARGVARDTRGGSAEEQEQAEGIERRLEALDEARRAGALGRTGSLAKAPSAGWAGERLVNATGDDWEPAIAADPSAPYVYVLHNRYGGTPACPSNCPDPAMILAVSSDGGKTFGPEHYLCVCRKVHGQFDPEIEVVSDTGDVYAAWMNDYNIQFAKSSDHGATWSAPTPVFGNLPWGDKPFLTTSANGQDVYISFNGQTDGDPWAAVSHDAGATWTQVKVTDSKRYYFEYGGAVLADGTVVLSEVSFTYTAPGGNAEGPMLVHVLRSTDGGVIWTNTVVDSLELGTPCTSAGCYADFYDSGPALAADSSGDLVIVYNGASTTFGPQTIYARSSSDGGVSWSDRVALSPSGVNAAFPAAAGASAGNVRVWFMDQRTGAWNTWYTTSTDLGATWSTPVKISEATSGTAYTTVNGFTEAYGDYGEIVVTSTSKTVAVWGEGISYDGPGGVWFNRQT